LLTGGTGLVGSAIKKLESEYPDYFICLTNSRECDLTNLLMTDNYFRIVKPDFVIHLAACVGGLFKNMNYKVDMLEKNMAINMNVLKCSHKYGVKKVVSCLSTCIFPDKTTYPINETMLHNGPPHHSNDAYAYAKRMLEVQSKAYREQYGCNFVCVIPTNIYGPHDNFSLEDGHVIPALIHRCFLNKKNNDNFVVKGSGKPLRQFIYSDDLAKLIMWVLDNYNEAEPIILSVDEEDEVSIGDVATLIAKEFYYDEQMVYDTSFSDGQYKKTADNSKLKDLMREKIEFTGIEDGIKKTVEWFKENYKNTRK
jgi:GDP-L-fucose synthase